MRPYQERQERQQFDSGSQIVGGHDNDEVEDERLDSVLGAFHETLQGSLVQGPRLEVVKADTNRPSEAGDVHHGELGEWLCV